MARPMHLICDCIVFSDPFLTDTGVDNGSGTQSRDCASLEFSKDAVIGKDRVGVGWFRSTSVAAAERQARS